MNTYPYLILLCKWNQRGPNKFLKDQSTYHEADRTKRKMIEAEFDNEHRACIERRDHETRLRQVSESFIEFHRVSCEVSWSFLIVQVKHYIAPLVVFMKSWIMNMNHGNAVSGEYRGGETTGETLKNENNFTGLTDSKTHGMKVYHTVHSSYSAFLFAASVNTWILNVEVFTKVHISPIINFAWFSLRSKLRKNMSLSPTKRKKPRVSKFVKLGLLHAVIFQQYR